MKSYFLNRALHEWRALVYNDMLKESLLRKTIFTSESALRMALKEFQVYFNTERPHQGIDNNTVMPALAEPVIGRKVIRCPRAGGLVNHYARVA